MTLEWIDPVLKIVEIVLGPCAALLAGWVISRVKLSTMELRDEIQKNLVVMQEKYSVALNDLTKSHGEAISQLAQQQVKQGAEITEKVLNQAAAAGKEYSACVTALERRIADAHMSRAEAESRINANTSEVRNLSTRINDLERYRAPRD